MNKVKYGKSYKRKKEQLRKILCAVSDFGIPLVCYQTSKFIHALGQLLGLGMLFFYKHYRFKKRSCLCEQQGKKEKQKQKYRFTLKWNLECIIIHHMSIFKQIQMRWSQLLGVEWFKKYWLIEGAFWKNSPFPQNIKPIQQCKKIIEITHGFQKGHFIMILFDICCIFSLAFFCGEKWA